ncbi:hypothetical protein [Streptomyces sp. PsTaAH-124]|uniref:hypothetical protein n=1 Tax=Streptomyces sp. PsTaAH-124 TaxID=1157638 RepID=UPI0003806E4B|nr:hypothetical protein [Streptomyces sp. PsTaAH-124]
MARAPRPRHITLGGRAAVALTVEEYDQLIASRRQIGGQSARVRVLAQRAKQAAQLLDDLEALIAAHRAGCPGHTRPAPADRAEDGTTPKTPSEDVPGRCLCGDVESLLRAHRDTVS